MSARILETPRTILRPWRNADVEPFAQLCADAEVMEHFPSVLTRDQAQIVSERIRDHFARHGFGFWALEIKGGPQFAGFVGLGTPRFAAPFMPCTEIGWRLARACWGQGYATEAAAEALRFGIEELGRAQIVSFTVPANTPSRRVMEKLGMKRSPEDDFDHPALDEGHPLRRHVLYRITREEWLARR